MYNTTSPLNQVLCFPAPCESATYASKTPNPSEKPLRELLNKRLTEGTLDFLSWGLFRYIEEQGGSWGGTLQRLSALVNITHKEVKRSVEKLKKAGALVSKRVGRLYHWSLTELVKAPASPSLPLLPQATLSPQQAKALENPAAALLRPPQALPATSVEDKACESTPAKKDKALKNKEDSPTQAEPKESNAVSSKMEKLTHGGVESPSRVEDLAKEQAQREAWQAFWKERGQYPESIKSTRVAAQLAEVERTYHPKELRPSFVKALDTNLEKIDYPIVFLLSKTIKDGKTDEWSLLPRAQSEAFQPSVCQHPSHRPFDTKALEVPEEELVQGKLGLLDKLNEELRQQAERRAKWNVFFAKMYEGCPDAPQYRGKQPLDATLMAFRHALPFIGKWLQELETLDADTLSPHIWKILQEQNTALGRLQIFAQLFERQGDCLSLKPPLNDVE